jgi:hypothetical protein
MVKAEAWSIRKTGIKAATEIIAKKSVGLSESGGVRMKNREDSDERLLERSLRGWGFLSIWRSFYTFPTEADCGLHFRWKRLPSVQEDDVR